MATRFTLVMDLTAPIRAEARDEWIPQIYEDVIRPGRTRSYELPFPERENVPVILQTLLGVELKVGRRRIMCPDLATARYLSVFARLGCRKVAVPYDITLVPALAKHLEVVWNKIVGLLDDRTSGLSPQVAGRARAALIRAIRTEIGQIGAGGLMPLFNTSTKQRDDR